jgi:bacterioferritin-associated ferredoxin
VTIVEKSKMDFSTLPNQEPTMYVCICKAVTDGQIKQAIREGCGSCHELMDCLKVGSECGRCRGEIHELLAAHAPTRPVRAAMPPLVPPVLCGDNLAVLN